LQNIGESIWEDDDESLSASSCSQEVASEDKSVDRAPTFSIPAKAVFSQEFNEELFENSNSSALVYI